MFGGRAAPVTPPSGPAEKTVVDVDIDKVEAAAKMLGAAKNPMIVVGGGAQEASAEVREVAEMLEAPVCSFRLGRGVLDYSTPPIDHHANGPSPLEGCRCRARRRHAYAAPPAALGHGQ